MIDDSKLDADSLSWAEEIEPATAVRAARGRARPSARPAVRGRPRIGISISRHRPAVLFSLTLLFALLGQYYFARVTDHMWDGIALYAVSGVFLVILARTLEGQPSAREAAKRPPLLGTFARLARENPRRTGLYVLAAVAALRVFVDVRSLPDNADHYPAMITWIVGIVALIAALCLPQRLGASRHLEWIGCVRGILASWEFRIAGALVVAAFLMRVLYVDTLPANFGGDEGTQGLSAVEVLEGRTKNVFGVGWFSMPNLSFWFMSLSLRAFGDNVFGLRMLWVLVGTASVLFCYLLVKNLFGIRLAIVATALVATYHFHIHYSRLGSLQIADAFFLLGTFYLLLRGLETGRAGWFASAGVLLGLAQYFYFGARFLIPIAVAAYLAYLFLADRDVLRRRIPGLMGMGLVAFLVALPNLAYAVKHPDSYMSRANQVGIFQSGWYARELQMGRDAVSVLTEQALRSLLAFNFYPDKVYWYHPGIPLLDFFSSIFFAVGLIYATWHFRDRKYFVVAASYWLALFFGVFLTENPPSSMRIVVLAPVASILVAIGMAKTVEWGWKAFGLPARFQNIALGVLVLVAATISVTFYFGEYSKHRTEGYGGPNTEVATEMAWYLKSLGADYRVYFFGPPRMGLDFSTIPFIARGVQGMDVRQPLAGAPTFVGAESRSVFVFLPERRRELDLLKQFVPRGREQETRGKELGQVLFVAYEVDRTAPPAPPSP